MREIIRVKDQYYILATSSLADDRTRVLKQGETFAVFDRYGDIHPLGLGEQGIYHQGMRHLSRLALRLQGSRPLLLSSTVREDNVLLAVDLANPDLSVNDEVAVALAHNGNVVNVVELRAWLKERGRTLESTCDAEVLLKVFAEVLREEGDEERALSRLAELVEGSYSLVAQLGDGRQLYARDPYGFRPLALGRGDGKVAAASESCAFPVNDLELVRDVPPGTYVEVEGGSFKLREYCPRAREAHCMFEYVYFARPDSVIEGECVYEVRIRLGEKLAETYDFSDADVIVPVPDTSRPAALGISLKTGVPVVEGLIKNRYIGRTFIMPKQEQRENAVKLKLNPIRSVIAGKHVVLVDDSIVRGTTIRNILKLLRSARKVTVAITCPPIIAPCFYGIDIACHAELIAARHGVEEIERIIGADRLCYQTIDGLVEAIGLGKERLCLACLTGEYPTPKAQELADKYKDVAFESRVRYWEVG